MAQMIVVGTDTHKSTHTCGAVEAATGRTLAERTAKARRPGFDELLAWARALGPERVWAIEDCRGVSGAFERFLVADGEWIVRIAPKHMAGARKSSRERGKSDSIDARAIARAALKEGIETLPTAHLDERALEIRLLLDHRDNLVAERSRDQSRLRWHLHDLWPALEIPRRALDRDKWLSKISGRLARAEQSARVRIARELVRHIKERTRKVGALERQLEPLVVAYAPQLLEERGCGPLTAAKLIGEIAGAERFGSDAKLARTGGVAPIPASSGNTHRHRLDRGGNRQLNAALHRLAVNKGKYCPLSSAYLERKQAEGKSRKEALRCLKRFLARRVWQLLRAPTADEHDPLSKRSRDPISVLALT
jgi:transposase